MFAKLACARALESPKSPSLRYCLHGPEAVPREGRGGAGDATLLLESDRKAAADVRVGGGGSRGFILVDSETSGRRWRRW
jgi:hypothetical protein